MTRSKLPFPLLDSPEHLANCNGWTEEVYRDLLALQEGAITHEQLDAKYLYRRAILTLDLTGFTVAAMNGRPLDSLLRILDAQKVCVPVFHEHGAALVRAFADDLVALFEDPGQALDAAFEIHRRIHSFNHSGHAAEKPPLACIGVGYGDVYAIGPNLAMGDEMNRASKLGEDTARGNETLVTSNVYFALRHRSDVLFEQLASDDQLFPYYRASPH
jgi:class 3 adenylate cyclase